MVEAAVASKGCVVEGVQDRAVQEAAVRAAEASVAAPGRTAASSSTPEAQMAPRVDRSNEPILGGSQVRLENL